MKKKIKLFAICITKEGIGISHLFCVDGVLLFFPVSNWQLQLITQTLKEFFEASGMKVNLQKSRMFCSNVVDQRKQQELSIIVGITRASYLGKYLDLPQLKARVTKEHFAPIIDKGNSHLGRISFWIGPKGRA